MTNDEIVKHAVANSSDQRTRRWLAVFRVGLVACIVVLGIMVLLLFIRQEHRAQQARDLASQVQAECDSGQFTGSVCRKAEAVKKNVESSPGVPGVNGTDGADGHDGKDGKDGRDGRDGKDGEDGTDGSDGVAIDGKDGANGLSAYEVAVANGYQGTADQWVASLQGKDGADGHDGEDAWPLEFVFSFETRSGRIYDCPISIDENGQQTNPAACQPREGATDVQPTE